MKNAPEELVYLYLHGEASESDLERLREHIERDPGLMSFILERAALDYDLRWGATRRSAATGETRGMGEPSSSPSGVRSRGRRFRRTLAASVAASIVFSVGLFGVLLATRGSAPTALIRSAQGAVSIVRGARVHAAIAGEALAAHDVVTIPEGASLVLSYEDGTTLTFSGGSQGVFQPSATSEARSDKALHLLRGSLSADVAKQPAGHPLRLLTPQATATVLGTRLVLRVSDGISELSVRSGAVSFSKVDGSGAALVHSGQFAQAVPERDVSVTPAVSVAFEAESGDLSAPMEVRRDPAASGGAYVTCSASAPRSVIDSEKNGFRRSRLDTGMLRLTFEVPAAGDYSVWMRAFAADGNHDSVYVSIDGVAERVADFYGRRYGVWRWTPVVERTPEQPAGELKVEVRRFHLTPGPHVLSLGGRESDYGIDRLIVTNSPDLVPELEE